MSPFTEESLKRRLTEPDHLAVAARFLMERGYERDEIAVELSRHFYVDIDMLNEVVVALAAPPAPMPTQWWRAA
ncbi:MULTISPECIES: hypothetical protein [unclassified Aminobacter]|uniref:hypothetical protein n=1 Tax=unclassified Aminobacter TaxID=2644704 RepID=UPI0004642396|nr:MULTISPECIES: hypothetical protein [unclassified Aminobacter]TWH31732.1 hypothetical protein L611_002400000670 [Aminobacter sp. J15]